MLAAGLLVNTQTFAQFGIENPPAVDDCHLQIVEKSPDGAHELNYSTSTLLNVFKSISNTPGILMESAEFKVDEQGGVLYPHLLFKGRDSIDTDSTRFYSVRVLLQEDAAGWNLATCDGEAPPQFYTCETWYCCIGCIYLWGVGSCWCWYLNVVGYVPFGADSNAPAGTACDDLFIHYAGDGKCKLKANTWWNSPNAVIQYAFALRQVPQN